MSGDQMFCVCLVVNGKPESLIGEVETCVELMLEMTDMSTQDAYVYLGQVALGFPVIVTEPYDLFIEIVPYDEKYLRKETWLEYNPTQQGDEEDDI